jgi:hypothetical protein
MNEANEDEVEEELEAGGLSRTKYQEKRSTSPVEQRERN